MGSFRNLRVWQAAHELALASYRATAAFPRCEDYALTSQLRRAAASIPANVAEGCGRNGDREFSRFVRIALGSAAELEYHVLLATQLQYLDPKTSASLETQCLIVQRMLAKLLTRLKPRPLGNSQ
jgi:four helix bundle protein